MIPTSHHDGGLCMVSRGQRQYLIQLALRHQAHPHNIHLRCIETATLTTHLLHLGGSGSIQELLWLLLILKEVMIVLVTAPLLNIPPMNLTKLTCVMMMIMRFGAIIFPVLMILLSIHYYFAHSHK